MIAAAVFDTKAYDREPLERAAAHCGIEWRFLEFRLTRDTAALLLALNRKIHRAFNRVRELITAHQAFLTREALSDIARTTVANLEALAGGRPLVEGLVLT